MKLRLLSIAGLVALTSAFVVVGCSDDDTIGDGSSGSGGASTAGKGGSGGKAGGSATAGKGGADASGGNGSGGEESGDTGGTGPQGGSSSGGQGTGGSAAGSGGKGGAAGSGGATVGGSGGASGSGGKGGAAGSGGAAVGGSGGASGSSGSGGAAVGGSGGASGSGGSGGAAAGSGGSGGAAAGSGGSTAGSGGSGGASVTAAGVETLSVPLTTTGQAQRFNFQNQTTPSTPWSLVGATITIRAYAPGAIGGDLSVFCRSTNTLDSAKTKIALNTLTTGFTNAVITVPAATSGGYDPALTDVCRIEIESDAAYGATFQSPATIVYIDSITSSNSTITLPFDTGPGVNEFASSGAASVTGSTYTWAATYP